MANEADSQKTEVEASEISSDNLPVASTIDGAFYPNLAGQTSFSLKENSWGTLASNILYLPEVDETSESTSKKHELHRIAPRFDYENGVVEFDLYVQESREKPGYYVDPDSDFLGLGTVSSSTEYEKVETLVGTVRNKIDQKDLPVIFDAAEVFLRYQRSKYGGDITPVLCRKDQEGNLKAMAYWQGSKQKWEDTEADFGKTLFKVREDETAESILTPAQIQMVEFQKVLLMPETSIQPSDIIPAPHLPGDLVSIKVRRREAADRINAARKLAAQSAYEQQRLESVANLDKEAHVLEQKLELVKAVIGPESMDKLKMVFGLYTEHRSQDYFPTEFASLAEQWRDLLSSIEVNKCLTSAQLSTLESTSAGLREVDCELMQDYLSKVSVKNWGVYAKIVVEDGQVFDAEAYSRGERLPITEFVVGRSSRSLHVWTQTQHAVTLNPGGHWGPEECIFGDGMYAIRRDVSEVYRVEFDNRGQVARLLDSIRKDKDAPVDTRQTSVTPKEVFIEAPRQKDPLDNLRKDLVEVQTKISRRLEDLQADRNRMESQVEEISGGVSTSEVSKLGARFVADFRTVDNEGSYYIDILDGVTNELIRFVLPHQNGRQFVEVTEPVEGGNFTAPDLGDGVTMRVKLVSLGDDDPQLRELRDKEKKYLARLPASGS